MGHRLGLATKTHNKDTKTNKNNNNLIYKVPNRSVVGVNQKLYGISTS